MTNGKEKCIVRNVEGLFDIKPGDDLFLTVPPELKELEKDEFGMVKLSKRNLEFICRFSKKAEPEESRKLAKKIKQEGREFNCTEDEYRSLFKPLAAENKTRTPEDSINALAKEWVNKGEYYKNGLLYGASKIVDELAAVPARNEKSLASKICKYLSEWWGGQDLYCINDTIVRKVLPYYWAYYFLKDGCWKQGASDSISTDYLDNCTYFDYMSTISKIKSMVENEYDISISFSAFDLLIWYSYRNDPIRLEAASIFSRIFQERDRLQKEINQ